MALRALETLGTPIRLPVLARYLGVLALSLAVMAAVPALAALLLGEPGFALRAGVVAAALAAAGWPLSRLPAARDIQRNEALAITALGFALGALSMVWPFAGAGLGPADAVFEAASAITTTGLSVLGAPEGAPRSLLFARAWMQWYGGLAILVLALALVLGPGAAARRLSVSQSGPDDLVTGTQARARQVMTIYGGLTVLGAALLWLAGAAPFDALLHALTAVSTGGFSTHGDSAAGLGGRAVQAALILLCLTGAISFSLQYRAARGDPLSLLRDAELHALLLAAAFTFGLVLLAESVAAGPASPGSAADAAFLALSAQTTAGFSTTEVATLAPASKLALILSMLVGGDVGSTAGGIKIFRLLLILQLARLLFARASTPPHAVLEARAQGRTLEPPEIHAAVGVVLLYAAAILVSWFCFLAAGHDPLDSLFDVVSALGTVGLSTGVTGPDLAAPLKFVLAVDMWMGRLEILAVAVLAYPRSWFGGRSENP